MLRSRKPRLAVGLPILIAGIAMIAVASVYVGPRLTNGMPPPCFPQSCPEIGYFAIIGVAGFIVAFWGGIQTFFALMVHVGAVQLRDGSPPPVIMGLTEEDQTILSIARDTHAKTKYPKRAELTGVGWRDGQSWDWRFFQRHGLSRPVTLVLAAGLRGRLLESDWRILLAYYFRRPRLRFVMRWFWTFMLLILLIPAGGLVVVTLYGIQASRLYGQLVAPPLAFLFLLYFLSRAKSVSLKEDRWVATSIGREELLHVFRKIDGLQLPEAENAKRRRGWIARLWPMPNITERIQNLSEPTEDR